LEGEDFMGYLVGLFLLIYYIVGVFSGNADTGVLIAAGLFMISGSIDICGTWIKNAIEKNNAGVQAGQILGYMMKTFNGAGKKDEAPRE
jgi:hypothetical protein